MRLLKAILTLLIAGWIAAVLVLNWQVVTAPARLNFLFGETTTHVGTVIVAVSGPLVLALLMYIAMLQSKALVEHRQHAKALQVQRTRADNADSSRTAALSATMYEEIAGLEQRLQTTIESLRGEVHDTERSIAAILGEMDDRLQRKKDARPVKGVGDV